RRISRTHREYHAPASALRARITTKAGASGRPAPVQPPPMSTPDGTGPATRLSGPLGRRATLAFLAAGLAAGSARGAVLSDAWFESQIDGKHIGYLHEARETDLEGGRKIVRT